ncbi:hypothetical protein B5S28_g2315 [[Candida] boidinii]|nr:hypothetical protein B5S28_g2315 [[Candida] boidinii]OWB61234.1 hypothetical protein B5S29_g2121 [[Candida] boidinii]
METEELELLTIENFGYRQPIKSISLFKYDDSLDYLRDKFVNLLVSSVKHEITIAAFKDTIIIIKESEINSIISKAESGELEKDVVVDSFDKLEIKFPNNITQIKLSSDESFLIIVDSNNKISTVLTSNLISNNLIFSYERQIDNKIINISTSNDDSSKFIVNTLNDKLYLIDISDEVFNFSGDVSAACWSQDGDFIIIGYKSGSLSYKNLDDEEIKQVEMPESVTDKFPVSIIPFVDNSYIVSYSNSLGINADEDLEVLSFIVNDSTIYEAPDLCPAWGVVERPLSYYSAKLINWSESESKLMILASSKVTEFSTITPNSQFDEANDSDRAQMPLSGDDDDSVIGMVIDLQSNVEILEPCQGVEQSKEIPRLLSLTHSGDLLIWYVWHSKDLLSNKVDLQKALNLRLSEVNGAASTFTATPNTNDKPAADDLFSSSLDDLGAALGESVLTIPKANESNIDELPSLDLNLNNTKSPFGTGASSGFGSSGFGNSNKNNQFSFGSSGFGSSNNDNKPSFGSSGFGNSNNDNKPSFGSSGFGNSNNHNKPSFGSTTFGSTAFGNFNSSQSPFSNLGQQSNTGAKQSPFGAFANNNSNNKDNETGSPFASFGSKTVSESPFAKLNTNSESTSPFGNTTPKSDSGSPFANLGTKTASPFGNFGAKSDSNDSSSPFAKFASKDSSASPFGNAAAKGDSQFAETLNFGDVKDSEPDEKFEFNNNLSINDDVSDIDELSEEESELESEIESEDNDNDDIPALSEEATIKEQSNDNVDEVLTTASDKLSLVDATVTDETEKVQPKVEAEGSLDTEKEIVEDTVEKTEEESKEISEEKTEDESKESHEEEPKEVLAEKAENSLKEETEDAPVEKTEEEFKEAAEEKTEDESKEVPKEEAEETQVENTEEIQSEEVEETPAEKAEEDSKEALARKTDDVLEEETEETKQDTEETEQDTEEVKQESTDIKEVTNDSINNAATEITNATPETDEAKGETTEDATQKPTSVSEDTACENTEESSNNVSEESTKEASNTAKDDIEDAVKGTEIASKEVKEEAKIEPATTSTESTENKNQKDEATEENVKEPETEDENTKDATTDTSENKAPLEEKMTTIPALIDEKVDALVEQVDVGSTAKVTLVEATTDSYHYQDEGAEADFLAIDEAYDFEDEEIHRSRNNLPSQLSPIIQLGNTVYPESNETNPIAQAAEKMYYDIEGEIGTIVKNKVNIERFIKDTLFNREVTHTALSVDFPSFWRFWEVGTIYGFINQESGVFNNIKKVNTYQNKRTQNLREEVETCFHQLSKLRDAINIQSGKIASNNSAQGLSTTFILQRDRLREAAIYLDMQEKLLNSKLLIANTLSQPEKCLESPETFESLKEMLDSRIRKLTKELDDMKQEIKKLDQIKKYRLEGVGSEQSIATELTNRDSGRIEISELRNGLKSKRAIYKKLKTRTFTPTVKTI